MRQTLGITSVCTKLAFTTRRISIVLVVKASKYGKAQTENKEFKKIKEIMTTKRLMRWCSVKMPEEN